MTARAPVLLVIGMFGGMLGGMLVAVDASAQTPAAKPAVPRLEREFSVGGAVTLPTSMGSADATLFGSNGTPALTLFRTENKMGLGFGPDVILGYQLSRRLWFEVAGGLTFTNLQTRIVDDFEAAPDETLEAPVTRLTGEGAVLWYLGAPGAKSSWFIRGSGGMMYETAGELSVSESGFTGSGGIGFKRWWRTAGKGTFKRIGLRAEFRGVLRMSGITLAERSTTFGPVGTVHVVFGY